MHNLKHNHVLHERNVIVTVTVATTPRVSDADAYRDRAAGRQLLADQADLRLHGGRRTCRGRWRWRGARGWRFEMMSTSYFLNRRSFRPSPEGGMPLWQDHLFIAMTKAASDASGFYRLPSNRVLELGQQLV